jgi:serine/threonine protein kinase
MEDTLQGIADYRFVRLLGEGAHGEFYLAEPPARLSLGADLVAVKVLSGQTNEDALRRATRELRAFATVRSPYLVRLYDAGQDGGHFFYATDYFPDGSLAAPGAPVDRARALQAVEHAARAAHALHEAGIVHGSIKPANVLLAPDGGRLADLGLAQLLAPGMTVTSVGTVGAVEFLDPAILRGERGSRASDIWSLGATVHYTLSGHGLYGPLPDDDPLLAVRTVMSRRPTVAESLAPADRALVEACLAVEPADRPPTAAAVADRIAALRR